MVVKPQKAKSAPRSRRTLIRTTVLDLLKELSALTKDDALVIAAMRNIFATCNVRLSRTLAPVRLVASDARQRQRSVLSSHRPFWA